MNTYYRRHNLRNRQAHQSCPPRGYITRTRYNYHESIREINPRRIRSPRRSRDRDYYEQQDDIDRTEDIRQERPEPRSNPVRLNDFPDDASREEPEPSTNEETAKTPTDDKNEDEN